MTIKIIHINVKEIVESPLCISVETGQKLFDKIEPLLNLGGKIILSFKGIEKISPIFVLTSLGKIYNKQYFTSSKKIMKQIDIKGLDKKKLKMLNENLKSIENYYDNYYSCFTPK